MERSESRAAGSRTYTITARLLHWASALVVAALLGLGLTMVRVVETDLALKFSLYQLHKSLGVTVLILSLCRLLWRQWHPPPPLPAALAPWERRAARANHLALYALLILTPLSGWAMVSISTLRVETVLFGWIPWPHIAVLEALSLETRQAVEPAAKWLHRGLAITIAGLAALHVAAALRHHFIAKNRMLARMWFSRRAPLAATACAALLAAAATGPALAADWTVDPQRSVLSFKARAGGQMISGKFERFSAEIEFDPAHPERARIAARIEMASLATGQAQIDQALQTEAWFAAARFPDARFEASGGMALAENRYSLDGTLTLRGVTRPLTLEFNLAIKGPRAVAKAEFTLEREDFGIGQGAIVRQLAVQNEVHVALAVHATRSARPD